MTLPMTAKTLPTHSAKGETLDDILVVDADVHVHESLGELAPYCDMPWRKSLEALPNHTAFISCQIGKR